VAIAGRGAAAVVAVVLVLATPVHDGRRRPTAGPLVGVIGFHWRVTQVVDAHGRVTVPRSWRAEIGFSPDGRVLGNDTVNALQADYAVDRGGYVARDAAIGAVGVAGVTPLRARTIGAVDAMFLTVATGPGQSAQPVRVAVRLHDDTLTLRRHRSTLTLIRAATQTPGYPRSDKP
jgi:hypothetical protein